MAAVSARERLPQRLPDIVFLTAALLLLIAGIFLATFVAMLGRPDTLESSMLAQSQADYQGEPSAPLFEPLDPDILDEIREDEEALQQSPTPRSEEAVQAEVQENDNAVAPDDIEAAANTPAASAPAAASATALPSPSHPATAPSPTISQTPAPGIVPPRPWASPTSSLFSRPTATVRATSPPTNTPSSPAQATATPAPASNASPTATLTPAPTRTNPPPTNAVATSPAQATAAASATPAPTNTPLPAIAPSATPRATATSTPRPVPTQTPRPAPSSTPVPAPSATPVPQPTETAILVEVPAQLSPLLECVQDNGDGSYTAYFGYVNPNSTAVTISVGKDNRLVPPPEVRGQPTTFQPGRHSRAFTVDFTQGNVLWFLDGSTATAHVGRASCD